MVVSVEDRACALIRSCGESALHLESAALLRFSEHSLSAALTQKVGQVVTAQVGWIPVLDSSGRCHPIIRQQRAVVLLASVMDKQWPIPAWTNANKRFKWHPIFSSGRTSDH